jgi:hypothetical protein
MLFRFARDLLPVESVDGEVAWKESHDEYVRRARSFICPLSSCKLPSLDSLVCTARTGGCAACAMVILAPFWSSFGASAKLVLLPLRPCSWIQSGGSHVRSVASMTNGSIGVSGKVRTEV